MGVRHEGRKTGYGTVSLPGAKWMIVYEKNVQE